MLFMKIKIELKYIHTYIYLLYLFVILIALLILQGPHEQNNNIDIIFTINTINTKIRLGII